MIQIKLLNKGGFTTISGVKFPIIVEGHESLDGCCDVLGVELTKFGFTFMQPSFPYSFSILKGQCVIAHDIVEIGPESTVPLKRCKAIRQGDQMQCVCGLAWDIDDTDLPECIT